MDFVGKVYGIDLGQRGFYGVAAEDKMFDLSSYLFAGAIITTGKKKNIRETTQLDQKIPLRIAHIIAEEKNKIGELASISKLPFSF